MLFNHVAIFKVEHERGGCPAKDKDKKELEQLKEAALLSLGSSLKAHNFNAIDYIKSLK